MILSTKEKMIMMKCKYLTKIVGGQDGAIYDKYLFRFENNGIGKVYDVRKIIAGDTETVQEIATFRLDRAELICPHSNSVVFGSEFYCEDDEFPLLYSNIYNNYMRADDPLKGVCCVYRIFRTPDGFSSELVQLIEIGFVEDAALWKMSDEEDSKRPYGNFVIDREKNLYYAFVMRENAEGTRYFSFDLPQARDGEIDEKYNVRRAVLSKDDIVEYFDCDHHKFMQGACCHNGKIYSLEGFNADYKPEANRPPVLRIIDPSSKEQLFYANLSEYGFNKEPEVIDFYGDTCICADVYGAVYLFEFDC